MSSLSENWKKVNNDPVCFGARSDSYGAFNIIDSGLIYTFKLAHTWTETYAVHKTYLYRIEDVPMTRMGTSSWEPSQCSRKRQLCNSQNTVEMAWVVHTIHTSLTVSVLTLLYSHVTTCHLHWPCLPGQEFRIRFGQDLHNCGESNNSGQTSVDVFAWYAWIGVLHRSVLVSKTLRKKAIFLWGYNEIQETIKSHHILPYDIMPYSGIACHTLPIATYRVTGRTGNFTSFQWSWNVNIL